jgi:hypothetical protein
MFPAGSVNHAMGGPSSGRCGRAMPFSSCSNPVGAEKLIRPHHQVFPGNAAVTELGERCRSLRRP